MPDFPVSSVSDAVSKLLSHVIPPRAYTYLTALVPGLFFEISILFANPEYAHQLASRAKDVQLGQYMTISIGLFLAFVIGSGFMTGVTLIQLLLGFLYRLRSFLWRQLCKWPLLPLSSWLLKKPSWRMCQWLNNFVYYLGGMTHPILWDSTEDVRKCWALLARRVLQGRYGIDLQEVRQDEWNVLYETLGTLAPMEVRGSILMIASEATGWCGAAAALFAPILKNRYYLGFVALLIVSGLVHDFYTISGTNNPRFLGLLKIRALLRELKGSSRTATPDHTSATNQSQEMPDNIA